MLIPLDRPAVRTLRAARQQRAGLTMLLGTTIGRQLQRSPPSPRPLLPTDRAQMMALRTDVRPLARQPDEFALGDLSLRLLRTPLLRPVVLLIGRIQVHPRLRAIEQIQGRGISRIAKSRLSQTPLRSRTRRRIGISVPASVAW